VVAVARSKAPLEALQSQYPKQVRFVAGDLADFSLGQKAVDLAIKEYGQLDGLVVNHGILEPVTRVGDSDAEEWRKNFDVNFFSAVAIVRGSCWVGGQLDERCEIDGWQVKSALPKLRETKGRIVLTSSGAATAAYSTWGAYGSSKAALNHLALTLSVEEPDVTTVSIRPGVVDTEMQRQLREVHHKAMEKGDADRFFTLHVDGKLLKPEQPGNVMARLVLDAPKEISGRFITYVLGVEAMLHGMSANVGIDGTIMTNWPRFRTSEALGRPILCEWDCIL
jgi:NAD(P)-dependent dehydrogenase (short-subunit alcohol dehydrogenase family)